MEKFKLNKSDVVLLIIDIQEKLAPAMKYKDKVVDNTRVLLSTAEKMNIPVIITEQYPKGLGSTLKEFKIDFKQDYILEKVHFSAYRSELKSYLNKINKKKVIVVGMEAHICVFQTVRDLLEDNYYVYIANDGVASRTKENYLNGLDLMKQMGAIITNTETVVFDLLKKSTDPEFKSLSKMIK
ncbi:MAG: isochorismatase family protein [Alteromonadaceae bacterium]|nr:isochorismatase family protein [Alteromonadaceae bacterium]